MDLGALSTANNNGVEAFVSGLSIVSGSGLGVAFGSRVASGSTHS